MIQSTMRPDVVVVGDVMLDRYLVGDVDRISPEAPVPVLKVSSSFERPGGAANVAANVESLGAAPRLMGRVGTDEAAASLQRMLGETGIPGRWLVSDASCATTTKTRLLSGQYQIARFDRETPVAQQATDQLTALLADAFSGARAVVLSDYAKGMCAESVCRLVIDTARRLDIPSIVDPKDPDFTKYRDATVITPNRREAAAAVGAPIADPDDAIRAARRLSMLHNFAWVVVTLGEQGLVGVSADDTFVIPTQARHVFDVTGAGDTVVAALAVCLGRGLGVREACQYANVAAGLQVGQVGTARIRWSEVLAAIHGQSSAAHRKICTVPELVQRLQQAREAGLKIGFTNGCFDILHHGHVALLAAARRECDRLIVAVNSDASVTRLKGPQRPFITSLHRQEVLASLESVDYVVEFTDDTPLALIEALRPDVLIKGGDYSTGNVVGADVVIAHGGRVVTPVFVPGASTTNIAETIVSSRAERTAGE